MPQPRTRLFIREIMLAAAITAAAVVVFFLSRDATEQVAVHQPSLVPLQSQ